MIGLVLPPVGNPLRSEIEAAATRAGVTLDVVVEVEGIRLIADLVAAGAGAAVLPETALPAGLEGVQVVSIAGLPPRRLALINARDAYLSIADRAVRDAALRMMRERFGTKRARKESRPCEGSRQRASTREPTRVLGWASPHRGHVVADETVAGATISAKQVIVGVLILVVVILAIANSGKVKVDFVVDSFEMPPVRRHRRCGAHRVPRSAGSSAATATSD